ncbi:hypothetical protein BDW22DRAFT_1202662 [Trametopsis cervina]|nr:hypothetical protein BDW22DRAFT_1202662 [Trametopsis cervina]
MLASAVRDWRRLDRLCSRPFLAAAVDALCPTNLSLSKTQDRFLSAIVLTWCPMLRYRSGGLRLQRGLPTAIITNRELRGATQVSLEGIPERSAAPVRSCVIAEFLSGSRHCSRNVDAHALNFAKWHCGFYQARPDLVYLSTILHRTTHGVVSRLTSTQTRVQSLMHLAVMEPAWQCHLADGEGFVETMVRQKTVALCIY